jgi:hypothetical protein
VLYDMTGKFITQITLPQRITTGTVLNVSLSNSSIANGNYILLLNNNDGSKVSKLIYVR